MATSWFLVAVRRSGAGRAGLWADARSLARGDARVEVLAAGDAVMELLVEPAVAESVDVRLLVDAHSLRRRGTPPLPENCTVVETDFVAQRLLDPDWKVVWR